MRDRLFGQRSEASSRAAAKGPATGLEPASNGGGGNVVGNEQNGNTFPDLRDRFQEPCGKGSVVGAEAG